MVQQALKEIIFVGRLYMAFWGGEIFVVIDVLRTYTEGSICFTQLYCLERTVVSLIRIHQ